MEEEEESCADSHVPAPSASSTFQFQAEEINYEVVNNIQHNQQQVTTTITRSYWINNSNTNPSTVATWGDIQSCMTVLASFWLIATFAFALTLGIRGSINLQLGPYCSRLIKINSMLVQSIKVEQIDNAKHGLMLYGFPEPPPLDVRINWTEMYNTSLPAKFKKEWIFYLNKNSQLDIYYRREGLVEGKQDPLFPNATLYRNIIYGSGSITQKISHSFTYYVSFDNMNLQNVEVELNITLNALLYNTTSTNHQCSMENGLCVLNLVLLKSNTAVLTTPGPREGVSDEEMYNLNVYYDPRWLFYFVVSVVVAVLIFLGIKLFKMFLNGEEREGFQQVEVVSERAPLLPSNDDVSSWSSSYESLSNEEEDLTMWLARKNSMEGKREGETSNDVHHLCVICSNSQRDCFFLPCGHSAACFACGTSFTRRFRVVSSPSGYLVVTSYLENNSCSKLETKSYYCTTFLTWKPHNLS